MTTSGTSELINGAKEDATHTFCSLYTFSVGAVRHAIHTFMLSLIVQQTEEIFKSFKYA